MSKLTIFKRGLTIRVFITGFVIMLGVVAMPGVVLGKSKSKEAHSKIDTLSFTIGVDIAMTLKQSFPELDIESAIIGLRNGFGDNPSMTSDSTRALITNYLKNVKPLVARKEGEAFLEANKSKKGVQVTSTGLQYKILSPGGALHPKADNIVTVHYTGTTVKGVKFDSSYDRGEPSSFPLDQVIKGWIEGLQLIGERGKIILYIPEYLAYGDNAPQQIGNGQMLIFEVELIKIEDAGADIVTEDYQERAEDGDIFVGTADENQSTEPTKIRTM